MTQGSSDAVHPVAASGFAKAAGIYAASRPGYPAAARDWLHDRLGIGAGSKVIEVGAGPGKFTHLLADAGADVLATDPVPGMLAALGKALPGVRTAVASANALPVADASMDAIVCATAFHWFASADVVAEFRRVLRPGGTLGLIWNVRDERVPWVARLSAITNRYEDVEPRQRTGQWRAPFPAPGFTDLHETAMAYEHRGRAEDIVLGRTLSTSFIAALPDDRRAEVEREVRALIADSPELQGPDVVFPYVTRGYDCRRID